MNNWFEGGDAITINMGAMKPSTGNVTGITINAKVSFENKNDEVVIDPSEGGGSTDTPDANAPTLTFQKGVDKVTYISDNEITYSLSDSPTSFDATIATPSKIESIVVKITAGNEDFKQTLADMQANIDFVNGVDIVGNEKFDSILSLGGEGLIGPKKGDTEYVFPIGVFFTFLNITKATDPDKAHQFDIVVTDQAGKSTTGTLKVHITE